jgi:hypothetical protein
MASAPVGTGAVRQAAAEEIVSPDPRPLAVERPARLMPRGVGRMHTEYVDGAPAAEPLPAPGAHAGVPYAGHKYNANHYPQGDYLHGDFDPHGGCTTCAGCDACCPDCCGQWNSCGPVHPCELLPYVSLTNLQTFAGVQGFTNMLNRGGTSSFGFYEGLNHSIPVCGPCLCGQVGMQWTQSNFNGSFVTPQDRQQIFLTTGLFRRVDCGLQGGLVFDYLHDEWDYQLDLAQLRGEIGWKMDPCNEFGFWFTAGVNDDETSLRLPDFVNQNQIQIVNGSADVEVNNLYAFYYRRQFACGGEGRLYGGFTKGDQGLFGGDALVPLNPCWSLQANFLYIASSHEGPLDDLGFIDETWNVSVGLVWTPFGRPGACCPPCCRPLFNVANNGTFATRFPVTGSSANGAQ